MVSVITALPYLGSINLWKQIVKSDILIIENKDNYQKQTLRNRTSIHGANGKLLLSIPIKHLGKIGQQSYDCVQIDNTFNWQRQHWKSLQNSYCSSPYFEFYETEISFMYKKKFNSLYEFNFTFFKLLLEIIDFKPKIKHKINNQLQPQILDIRNQINKNIKDNVYSLHYRQVFHEKNGFIPNLSIIDLIFNVGPRTLFLLKSKK